MKFYAAWHYYSVTTANDVTKLYAFDSKKRRDMFVDNEVRGYDINHHLESVTRDEARRYMPTAFNGNEPYTPHEWHAVSDGCKVYERI